jgi:hypothetical protein
MQTLRKKVSHFLIVSELRAFTLASVMLYFAVTFNYTAQALFRQKLCRSLACDGGRSVVAIAASLGH